MEKFISYDIEENTQLNGLEFENMSGGLVSQNIDRIDANDALIIDQESTVGNQMDIDRSYLANFSFKQESYIVQENIGNDGTAELSNISEATALNIQDIKHRKQELEKNSNSEVLNDVANNVPGENGRVLINVGHSEEEPEIYLKHEIASVVKPHQIDGIRFMYDQIVQPLAKFTNSNSQSGCILAHSMGLGKTLQVIAFCDIILQYTDCNKILCLAPFSIINNWKNEFKKFLPTWKHNVYTVNIKSKKDESVIEWANNSGVLLVGYEMYRHIIIDKKRSETDAVKLALQAPDLLICDEGHRIKNLHATLSQVLRESSCKRKIILTGYPLQNNLLEYWCMIDLVKPQHLGSISDFTKLFEIPIVNGQCIDSTPANIELMHHRVYVLHKILKLFVQRRGTDFLKKSLPPLQHYVLLVQMTALQKNLYEVLIAEKENQNPLVAFILCWQIFNHTDMLFDSLNKNDIADLRCNDTLLDDNGKPINSNQLRIDKHWTSAASKLMQNYVPDLIENSPKIKICLTILKESVALGDKIIIFSQSITTLDIIEKFLKQDSSSTIWNKDWNYFRLDGSTTISKREKLIKEFQINENIKLFLMSIKTSSEGINLTAANRVVIFESSWNPCCEMQAVSRVYRYGQQKPCFIYRLIMDKCLERNIYDRQVNKQVLSCRVVDQHNPEPTLTSKEANSLFTYKATESYISSSNKYSDVIIQEIIKNQIGFMSSEPLEHHNFFIDRPGKKLSIDEKCVAMKQYTLDKAALLHSKSQSLDKRKHRAKRPKQ